LIFFTEFLQLTDETLPSPGRAVLHRRGQQGPTLHWQTKGGLQSINQFSGWFQFPGLHQLFLSLRQYRNECKSTCNNKELVLDRIIYSIPNFELLNNFAETLMSRPGETPMEMKAAITVAAIVANPLVITFKQSWKMKMAKYFRRKF
jgi:hypothetical protein